MALMTRTCSTDRMNVERILARVFVVLGGAFWVIMMAASNTIQRYSNLVYNNLDIGAILGSALVPLAIAVVVFVVGLFFEYLAALLLFIASAAVIVYGIIAGWEFGVWLAAGLVLVAPMLIAGLLYVLAARMQRVCELEGEIT